MASNLRVGSTHAYQPYREVEQVEATPKINSQQQRDGQTQQQRSKQHKGGQTVRRFVTMRKLIDALIEVTEISRVDYHTVQSELNDLGLAILEVELIEQFLQLNIALDDIDDLLQQIRQQVVIPTFEAGDHLIAEHNFFPVFVAGISEYNLCFDQLRLPKFDLSTRIGENLDIIGRFIEHKNRIWLDFHQTADAVVLKIMVHVAVSELDDAGRRVILYQRQDQSYALYADKQIDLSI